LTLAWGNVLDHKVHVDVGFDRQIGAKFRGVRQSLGSPTKQEFAVTCGRMCVRAAGGACLGD